MLLPTAALAQTPVPRFEVSLARIAAGTHVQFLILPNSGAPLSLEEHRTVTVPVAARAGGLTIPGGALLVGRFERTGETSGALNIESLVIGQNVYAVRATSAPIPGWLRRTGTATPRYSGREASGALLEAGGDLLGLPTDSRQTRAAVGLLGTLFGAAAAPPAPERQTGTLTASLKPMQTLGVQFLGEVDFDSPIAQLPNGPADLNGSW
ncbi:MAG: hypothetical protein KME03_14570 [Aphanocapsa lilacina HA4352-LM1]|nr:hypothetical protein [Aphanocapsa lilacina HA4352-LM1]